MNTYIMSLLLAVLLAAPGLAEDKLELNIDNVTYSDGSPLAQKVDKHPKLHKTVKVMLIPVVVLGAAAGTTLQVLMSCGVIP